MTKVGYRMTEIGEIPEEWSLDILENEVEIMDSRRVPLSEVEREQRKGPFPYCGANGIIDYVDDYIFDEEAILLAEDGGSYGKFQNSAYLMDGKYWVNNHAHIIKGKRGIVNNKYILYWLNYSDINKYISGSTRAKLNQERLKSIPIPRVPLPEQQKIAEILTTADDEIQKVNEQITLTEQLKNGLMQRLLTIGIGHTRFKMTEIGEIPEEWEIKKIKDISTYVTDGTHKTPHYIEEAQSGVPFISTENIKPYSNEFDFSRYKRYIDEISYKELSKRAKPEKGDLLISKCGTIGRTQLIRNDIKIGIFVGLLLVKIKNNTVSGQYFEDLLNSDKYRTIMESISPGSTRKTLAIGMFKNILIPLPPLQEQQKIAEILTTVDNKLELLGNKREKLNVLKKGLMDDLLTGKVRVKV